MLSQDLTNLLAQCRTTVLIVADNAKSPIHAASTRAEPMPPLSPYKRTMKAKRATRRGRRIHNTLSLESPPSSPHHCVISKKRVLQLQAELMVPACRWTAESALPCIPKPPLHDAAPRKGGSSPSSSGTSEEGPRQSHVVVDTFTTTGRASHSVFQRQQQQQ
jgi:hypothetical protein